MEDTFHLGVKALIRNADGKALLLQFSPEMVPGKEHPVWGLPGGRIEKDSSVEDTLRRELLEETGLQDFLGMTEIGMVLSNVRIPVTEESTVGLVLSVYSCTIATEQEIVLSDEHVRFDWFSLTDVGSMLRDAYPESFCKLIVDLE